MFWAISPRHRSPASVVCRNRPKPHRCFRRRKEGRKRISPDRTVVPRPPSNKKITPVWTAAALERLQSIVSHDKRHQLCQHQSPHEKECRCYHQAPETHKREEGRVATRNTLLYQLPPRSRGACCTRNGILAILATTANGVPDRSLANQHRALRTCDTSMLGPWALSSFSCERHKNDNLPTFSETRAIDRTFAHA